MPFVLRGLILVVMFAVAFGLMHDIGFTPCEGRPCHDRGAERRLRFDPVRLARASREVADGRGLTVGGVGIYAFYALQPYLLELYGDPDAYQIAGLVAAVVAGAQIVGGLAAPRIRRLLGRRTSALILIAVLNVATLALIGLADSFWVVLGLIVVWGLLFSASMPIRKAYLNGLIPSRQRATILSFDSMMDSTGGVWTQPLLGRAADVWGYAPSYLIGAGISALAVPSSPCLDVRTRPPTRSTCRSCRSSRNRLTRPGRRARGPSRRPRGFRRCGVAFMVPSTGRLTRTATLALAQVMTMTRLGSLKQRALRLSGIDAPEAAPAAARLPYPGVMRLYAATGDGIARLEESSWGVDGRAVTRRWRAVPGRRRERPGHRLCGLARGWRATHAGCRTELGRLRAARVRGLLPCDQLGQRPPVCRHRAESPLSE